MLASIPGVRLGNGVVSHLGRTLPLPERLSDGDAFTAHRAGLDLVLVSPPPGLYIEGLAAERTDYASRVNDDLVDSIAGQAAGVLGWLPLGSPQQALAEIDRLRETPAVAGFTVGTALAGALVDPAFDRVWQALAEADLALQLHPDSDPWRDDAKGVANPSILGFPAATTSAVTALLLSGDGFWASGARLCVVHGGGFLALALPRLVRSLPGEQGLIGQRAARLYTDALVFDAAALHLVEESFAPEHVLPGSDWPFPLGLPELPARRDWPAALAGWAPRASKLMIECRT